MDIQRAHISKHKMYLTETATLYKNKNVKLAYHNVNIINREIAGKKYPAKQIKK